MSLPPGNISAPNLTQNCNLFYDDFSNGFSPNTPTSPYQYFTPTSTDAAGGITASKNNLTIRSSPYTYTAPTPLDSIKYAVVTKNYFNAPSTGELVFETIMSAQQTGLSGLPDYLKSTDGGVIGVNNVNSDVRLSYGYFAIGDLITTLLICGFILTNEDIYVTYVRPPFGKVQYGGPGPDYNSFECIIPVRKRNVIDPSNDFVKLSLGYNYTENYIRYSINDEEVYRINRLGFPIERQYEILNNNTPNQLNPSTQLLRPTQFGFAILNESNMSAYNPQNPGNLQNAGLVDLTAGGTLPQSDPKPNVDGTNKPCAFLAQYNQEGMNGTLFGQGVNTSFKYFAVYTLNPFPGPLVFPDIHSNKQKILITTAQENAINGVNSTPYIYQ